MNQPLDHFHEPVLGHMRKNVAMLWQDLSVQQALEAIRQHGIGDNIVYFYVTDIEGKLTGVLPTRRLLTSPPERSLSDIMIHKVVALSHRATLLEACEFFARHKFLALPVVDKERRILGVVDVTLFSAEISNLAGRQQLDEVFEVIGFHVSQVRDASPWKAFRYRFPWLLATIASGLVCAVLVGAYEATLAKSLVLAFFLVLTLGLGESVSIQSMSVAIQALRAVKPTLRWYLRALRREVGTALLLGLASGISVGLFVWLWRDSNLAPIVIGSGIALSLLTACFFGLSIPAVLHSRQLNPKIAAGPITLALTDIFTIFFYFTLAAMVL